MSVVAFLVGLTVLIAGIVRARRSEKGSRKGRRSRTLAWIGGVAMLWGVFSVPVPEEALEGTAPVVQEAAEPEPPAEVEAVESNLNRAEVMTICQDGIKDQLAAPNTAKFPGFWAGFENNWGSDLPERSGDDTSWYWDVEVESENLYGVPLTSYWSCVLPDDGEWTVEQMG